MNLKLVSLKLILLILCLNYNDCYTQWTKLTFIENENFNCISTNQEGHIYAGSSNGLVYKSTNGGVSWLDISIGFTPDVQINDIAVDNNTVFIATFGEGIYKSTNGGINWSTSNTGINTEYIMSLMFYNDYIFAGAQNGVYKSSNKGAIWVLSSSGISFTHGISSMVSSDSTIFVSSHVGASGIVFRSTDHGSSWDTANSGLPNWSINQLASSNGTVFAQSQFNGIYKTTNGGLNWIFCLNSGTVTYSVFAHNDTVLVGKNGGAYSSINNGVTWIFTYFGPNYEYVKDFANKGNVYFGASSRGLYKSNGGFSNWSKMAGEISNINFSALFSLTNIVIAGTDSSGVYYSSDFGSTWAKDLDFDLHATCKGIIYDDLAIYTYGSFKLLRSTDIGANWIPIGAGLPDSNVTCFSAKAEYLLVGMGGAGIFKSTNFGVNWIQCNNGLPGLLYVLSVLITDSSSLSYVKNLGNDSTSLYFSSNKGSNWEKNSASGIQNYKINVLTKSQNLVLAGLEIHGIYYSSNYGRFWQPANYGLPSECSISSFVTGYNFVYAGSYGNGVFGSTNYGLSWIDYSDGLDNLNIKAVCVNNMYVYACGGPGLWKRGHEIGIIKNTEFVPSSFFLYQNYPNPFNPNTKIKFSLPPSKGARGMITQMTIYDILGREVSILVNEELKPGTYE